jgi:arginyl-tRNA synthetase
MQTIPSILQERLSAAVAEPCGVPLVVTPASDPRFGDYQTNAAMQLAKQRKANPRALAQEILQRLEVSDLCSSVEIAGAGFLNFHLRPDWVQGRVEALRGEERLGVPAPERVRTIVVDFSSPNVAKPMHVGHIRSTILGDSLARIAEFIGHRVIRDNHIGDWGTQFGMLLLGWKTILNPAALGQDALSEMERIYKDVSARCREDASVLEAAKQELVRLQSGDAENLGLWHEMIRLSQTQFDTIYGRLGIRFDFTLGESFYNDRLKAVVEKLLGVGIARGSDGAICVFSGGTLPPEQDPFLIKDKEGWRDNPALVRKSDGAANYTTTDLATLEYRMETWAPDEIMYVTDGRQQLHFRQLFAVFARWQPATAAKVRLAHVWFGSILGEDGRPFKTRSGETIRLAELLDEAVERSFAQVTERNPSLSEEERREIARIIGLGAVKYADLLPHRQGDYVFSWERMLSFQGNTAPYLQNACVRIRSIFRKLAEAGELWTGGAPLILEQPTEVVLGKKLLQFGEVLPGCLEEHRPNLLANYLYELANTFHAFYEACPVLKSEGARRASRLGLCEISLRMLHAGLGLLGIEVPARM